MRWIVLVSALLLTSCGGKVDENVTKIVDATKQICSFVPTDATVTAVIAAMGGESVHAIATAICDAVTGAAGPAQRSTQTECPKVKDVCIEGEFEPKEGE